MTGSDVRLSRTSWGTFAGYAHEELWLCDTHLLCIRSMFGIETYQRFYYGDIERISVCHTIRRRVMQLGLLVFTAFLSLALAGMGAPLLVWSVLMAPLVLLFVINALCMSCRVELQTRVNTRRLTSLGHVRVARRALAILCERILEAQAAPPAGPGEGAPSEARSPSLAPPPLFTGQDAAEGGAAVPPPLPSGAVPDPQGEGTP